MDAYDARAKTGVWEGPRYRMRFRMLGDGPPLVLAAGIASTYRGYALLLNRLARHFTTVCYDYPGEHADDAARLSRITHADLRADLVGLCDELAFASPFLLGLSFGSTVVLGALADSPDRFASAAIQGGFAHRHYTIAERAALQLGRRFPGSLASLPLRQTVLTLNNRNAFPTVLADRWQLYLEDNSRTPIASLAHRCDLVARLDLRPQLSRIQTPILLIHGNEDRIVPHVHFEALRAALPRATTQLLPLVGHQVHYTHPELIARLVTRFFLPNAVIDEA